MKSKLIFTLGLVIIVSSCSMNFLFLHPHNLNEDSTFQQYNGEKKDTMHLKFANHNEPNFYYESGINTDLGYSIESVNYPNSNKDTLNAWVIRPTGVYNGTTLFFLHGNTGHVVLNYQLATPFAERGFKVFLFDYSEFGFSQGKAKRKNVLIDANSSLDYLLSLDEFKDEKIIIYGQSLGGHLAPVIGKQNESKIDGVVLEGAFSSHDDIAGEKAGFIGKWFVGEKYSAKDSIPLIKKPVLVIHSIGDRTIPIEHGKRLYAAATEPKSFYQIDSTHILGPLYYADSIVARIERMFPD
jgi:alpha-beta hydrolase superfamily lysophospholipase